MPANTGRRTKIKENQAPLAAITHNTNTCTHTQHTTAARRSACTQHGRNLQLGMAGLVGEYDWKITCISGFPINHRAPGYVVRAAVSQHANPNTLSMPRVTNRLQSPPPGVQCDILEARCHMPPLPSPPAAPSLEVAVHAITGKAWIWLGKTCTTCTTCSCPPSNQMQGHPSNRAIHPATSRSARACPLAVCSSCLRGRTRHALCSGCRRLLLLLPGSAAAAAAPALPPACCIWRPGCPIRLWRCCRLEIARRCGCLLLHL